MSQAQTITVMGFSQKFIKGPEGHQIAVDMVTWVPNHAPLAMKNTERVDRLNPDNLKYSDNAEQTDDKRKHMAFVWAQIEPRYLAWKEGREVPIDGTPLVVWPAISPEQAEIFRLAGIRTVEAVRDMPDSVRARVSLPNTRELMDLARVYIENSGAAAAAQREAEKDQQISSMADQIAELQKALAERGSTEPKTVDPDVLALREQLDARGIEYHHSHKAPKLRELLATGGTAAA